MVAGGPVCDGSLFTTGSRWMSDKWGGIGVCGRLQQPPEAFPSGVHIQHNTYTHRSFIVTLSYAVVAYMHGRMHGMQIAAGAVIAPLVTT